MALVSEVVNRAYRLLNVIDVNDATPAVLSANAIVALNAMLGRWEANGLTMGFAPVSAVDDVLPVPDEAIEAVTYSLAVRLAPEFAQPAAWDVILGQARDFLAELRRDRMVASPLYLEVNTPRGRSGRGFNIAAMTADEYGW